MGITELFPIRLDLTYCTREKKVCAWDMDYYSIFHDGRSNLGSDNEQIFNELTTTAPDYVHDDRWKFRKKT